MPTKIRLPDDIRKKFEDLESDTITLRMKYVAFSEVIHEEQKAVALRAKSLWLQTMFDYGLEGEWRYVDGCLTPMDEVKPD